MELPLKNVHRSLHNVLLDTANSLERQRITVTLVVAKEATEKNPANSVAFKVAAVPKGVENPDKAVADQLEKSAKYYNGLGRSFLTTNSMTITAEVKAAKEKEKEPAKAIEEVKTGKGK